MLRDLHDVMSRTVYSVFCSIGMPERSFDPLQRDLPLLEHLTTVRTEIHKGEQTLKQSLFVE
jgi:hypothetical protein